MKYLPQKLAKYIGFSASLCFLFLTIFHISPVHAAPPTNFQVEQLVVSGLDAASGLGIAPDGRIFLLERTGKIKIYKAGQLLPTPFADLPSAASGDRGLIGVAFDPDFATNHYVYFYYTGLDLLNHLVRFNAEGDIGTDGPTILYQTTSPSNQLHVGGSIVFGPDGKLYFAVGDNGYGPNAQNLANPHGKILRINKDGTIPEDNPFVGQDGALPEIWAYGLRNPWRFQFDPHTGRMYLSDVGADAWEEINRIEKGKNYGWPICEGNCSNPNFVNPIYTYPHNGSSSAATGGPIYWGTMFPQEYQGRLFFGDYAQGFLKTMGLDADGNMTDVADFDLGIGSIVDLKEAPDGSIYYVNYYPARLYRLSYAEGNQQPVAVATASVTKGLPPLTVNFSSAGSYDPDGSPLTYHWDFGDNTSTSSAEQVISKTYPQKGTYLVEMTVTDGTASAQAVPLTIQVGISPTVTIGQPADGTLYHAGDSFNYTVHAIDGVGNDINDSAIQTEVIFHHGTHIHPFLGPITGRTGSFTAPTTGEPSPDTWFEIKAKATDANGLSTTTSIYLYPYKSSINFDTVPSGLQVTLDGQPVNTPYTYQGVVNFQREVSLLSPQVLNGKTYEFTGWSDGGEQTHTISVPTTPATLTANFVESQAQVQYFQGEYFNNRDLQGEPTLKRADNEINFDWGYASPDLSIPADLFSARWTKTQTFTAGVYRFTTTTDDGVRLKIDGKTIIDKWVDQSAIPQYADTSLEAGNHTIVLEYYENAGGAVAKLSWDRLGDIPAQESGFLASYYNNKDLSGTPVLVRSDNDINFSWGLGSPDPAIQTDQFSARWTKQEEFENGTYRFSINTDDGMRILLDNQIIFDKWYDQNTDYTFDKSIDAGSHTITIEYFENAGDATAHVHWNKVTQQSDDGFDAQYFDNQTLSGLPTLVRVDPTINFNWGEDAPDPSMPANNFSVRWTKHQMFEGATYRFSTTADDGVRLKIDGITYIDKWTDQSPHTYEADVVLEGGEHVVVLEYYENGGGAVAKLSWETVGALPTTNIQGSYFTNKSLSGNPTLSRVDDAINFDWGEDSPGTGIPTDNFSVRWKKIESFAGGDYRFTVTADDGIRIFVDGVPLLDKWIDQPPTTYTIFTPISAGTHTIIVEYYENGGGAVAKVNWQRISGPPTGNYSAQYFNNKFLSGTPALTRTDAAINFTWLGSSPDPSIQADNFSARWQKTETFEGSTYRFTSTSDDGIRIYLDDIAILDKWFDQSSNMYEVEVPVSAGTHSLRIEYYENGGDATAKVTYEPVQ